MLELQQIELAACDWAQMDAFADRLVFQTREWLAYLTETQGAEPVVCEVRDGSSVVGFFTGLAIRRYGARILGSPFPGWGTGYLGFNLQEGVPRAEAAAALRRFAFRDRRCVHLELRDRFLDGERLDGYASEPFTTFEIDLDASDDELFGRMSSACRRCIRKAEKVGVTIEEASDEGFADEYYAQLEDVFAKQSLTPPYGRERVRSLVEHLLPAGRVLLLRARDAEGTSIATGIFPGHGRMTYFWGGASWREHQINRPNEAVFWHAMRFWRERGAAVLDMGGGGEYKRKYGGDEIVLPTLMRSRLPGLQALRRLARTAHAARQRVGR